MARFLPQGLLPEICYRAGTHQTADVNISDRAQQESLCLALVRECSPLTVEARTRHRARVASFIICRAVIRIGDGMQNDAGGSLYVQCGHMQARYLSTMPHSMTIPQASEKLNSVGRSARRRILGRITGHEGLRGVPFTISVYGNVQQSC